MSEENLPRAFKGIWIPKEIWIHNELSPFEKMLWAEIDSLDDEQKGCTASNGYLQKFFNVKERTIQRGLSKLKNLGLIRYESFDGKIRSMRSCLKTTYDKFDRGGMTNLSPLGCQECHPEIIVDSKEKSISLVPPQGETTKTPSLQAQEIAKELWKRVEAIHPKHKPPKLEAWAKEIDSMHRLDKREWGEIREVIVFAFEKDEFWAKTLQSAEGLRKHFDKIWVKIKPLSSKAINKEKNKLMAMEAKSQLRAAESLKHREIFISDYEVVRLDTGARIDLSLDPTEFENKFVELFNLYRS